jgi:diaminohydroxyphosphoribosylaminopyrimidine deaminase/5-amino-6-(5-phosphoribosylamino)uracil reductase
MNYEQYIARCIEIARRGEYYVAPNPMVGAVLVAPSDYPMEGEGKVACERIIAEGWHERFGEGHAEVNCFKSLEKSKYRDIDLSKCTLFVSLEPCSHYGKTPPCAKLIIEKGVGRVVVGMLDPNPLVAGRGVKMLREAGIEVVVGVLEKECRELNKRFLMLHEHHRPYVVLKWAQTGDGFIDRNRRPTPDPSLKGGENEEHLQGALAISTERTKAIVHRMRAENMAIMVGTNTVIMDNPRLMTTHWEGRNPIRVTVDRHGRIPMESKIFERKESDYPGIDPVIVYRERTEWEYILEDLAGRGIHSIMVEGGTTLLNHIIETGLWDEMHIEVAPEITIGEGVAAPNVNLSDFNGDLEVVDGHKLYTIYRK